MYYLQKFTPLLGWTYVFNKKTKDAFTYQNETSARQAARKLSTYSRIGVFKVQKDNMMPRSRIIAIYENGRLVRR